MKYLKYSSSATKRSILLIPMLLLSGMCSHLSGLGQEGLSSDPAETGTAAEGTFPPIFPEPDTLPPPRTINGVDPGTVGNILPPGDRIAHLNETSPVRKRMEFLIDGKLNTWVSFYRGHQTILYIRTRGSIVKGVSLTFQTQDDILTSAASFSLWAEVSPQVFQHLGRGRFDLIEDDKSYGYFQNDFPADTYKPVIHHGAHRNVAGGTSHYMLVKELELLGVPAKVLGGGANGGFDPVHIGAPVFIWPTAEGKLRLTWQGIEPLEQARSVSGPWTVVPGATSPFFVDSDGPARFFRVRPYR